jgi:hypothetical protein
MAKAKGVEDVTEVPEGLDVVPTVPGTFVGGHDLQGADGTPRTDRPGEILGTPVTTSEQAKSRAEARALEAERADAQTEAVDKNNREVLPLLGGKNPDNWKKDITVEVPESVRPAKDRDKS